ncbi:hypothetical protein FAIPA1_40147 [Frankia sp. AiPs1]
MKRYDRVTDGVGSAFPQALT